MGLALVAACGGGSHGVGDEMHASSDDGGGSSTVATSGTADGGSAESGADPACGAHASSPDCACDAGYVLVDGECVDEGCTAASCGGHGVCTDADPGIACACDEGFSGDRCEAHGDDYHRRTLLVPGLADPDVWKESDDLFFLVGTGSTATLPIYTSVDLALFTEHSQYDPSALDPSYDYCWIWAPDLTKYAGTYDLYFSAHRVANGAACPPAGQEVTTFHAVATSIDLEFGVPELVDTGPGLPRSMVESGCPPDGCSHAIRIDSAAYDDGVDRWFSYVWFEGGNNIAAFRFADPSALVLAAGPAVFSIPATDESINEGPDLFARDGRQYLFFSGGFFDSQYAMYYVLGSDVADLTRARNVRRHSEPLRSADGDLVQTHGHNSIVERRGEWFNVFHIGEFDDTGNLTGRSTHKQRLAFRDDGSILALTYVDVRWSRIPGAQYSLDVVARDGTVIGPCIAVGRIGAATSARYGGICPDGGDARMEKADVAAIRIYHSTDGTWTEYAEAAYDGGDDRLFVPLEGGTTDAIELHWNERATAAEYSLDVQRSDGTWIAPCVGVSTLQRSISYVYDGACTTAPDVALPADLMALRVCSAENGDWAAAVCGTVPYDGMAAFVDVAIP